MKKLKYIFGFLSVVFLMSSCSEDLLDIQPLQSIPLSEAISTEANLRSFLIGTYDELGQVASYGGRTQIISDLLGNTGDVTWQGTFIDPRQFNNKAVLVDNGFVAGNWNNNFETINQLNLILDNSDKFTDATERATKEGEAKFLRALAYFDLIRNFAVQYNAATASSDLGVPLRLVGLLEYAGDLSIARSSVQAVYDQILSDLADAYANLPASNGFFADRYAARALQARVWLQMGNYPMALTAADDVLQNSGHSLAGTYAGAFNNDNDSSEDVFTFQVTDQTGANGLITFYASEANGGRGGDIFVNGSYVSSFDSPNDERASFFVFDTGDRLTAKFTNQFANVSVFRIAEMHLIRIECNFRENSAVGGLTPLQEINALRGRSMADPLTTIDLPTIMRERTFELAFEGFTIHDLKRTGTDVGAIPIGDNSLVLPIPQSEMDTNNLMDQNPGYEN